MRIVTLDEDGWKSRSWKLDAIDYYDIQRYEEQEERSQNGSDRLSSVGVEGRWLVYISGGGWQAQQRNQ